MLKRNSRFPSMLRSILISLVSVSRDANCTYNPLPLSSIGVKRISLVASRRRNENKSAAHFVTILSMQFPSENRQSLQYSRPNY